MAPSKIIDFFFTFFSFKEQGIWKSREGIFHTDNGNLSILQTVLNK